MVLFFYRTVPDAYADKLIVEGLLTEEEKKQISSNHFQWLNDAYKSCDSFTPQVSTNNCHKKVSLKLCQILGPFFWWQLEEFRRS